MKVILKFFATWFLFALMVYLLCSVAQGNFDASMWTEDTRHGVSAVAGIAGFWFSVFVTLFSEI